MINLHLFYPDRHSRKKRETQFEVKEFSVLMNSICVRYQDLDKICQIW